MLVCPTCSREFPSSGLALCPDDGTPLRSAGGTPTVRPDPRVGSVLAGRYLLGSILGTGGMGTVYLATDLGEGAEGAQVAIKVVSPAALTDPAFIGRFWQEIRAARAIMHRQVVRILGFGDTAEGTPFLVMEYVAGETLDAVLRRSGPLPPERAAFLARELACGIEAAHKCQVMHRDLKPANLMVCDDGAGGETLKILDFGLAKPCDANPQGVSLTETGLVFGTPEYMSPEQARGERVDYRTDLYAAGCILFEMLAGHGPFGTGSTVAMLLRHMRSPVPRFEELHPPVAVPEALAEIAYTALQKPREDRFQTASALRRALETAMNLSPRPSIAVTLAPPSNPGAAGFADAPTPEAHAPDPIGRPSLAPPGPAVPPRGSPTRTSGARWGPLVAVAVALAAAALGFVGGRAAPTGHSAPEPSTPAPTSAPAPTPVTIRFRSEPPDARLEVRQATDGAVLLRARTPAEVALPRGAAVDARLMLEGRPTRTVTVDTRADGDVLVEFGGPAPASDPPPAVTPEAGATTGGVIAAPAVPAGPRPSRPAATRSAPHAAGDASEDLR
ncbi:protein kinase [Myxococcota bacterium]|nr:protein kinase [Myxococcota bacterium]